MTSRSPRRSNSRRFRLCFAIAVLLHVLLLYSRVFERSAQAQGSVQEASLDSLLLSVEAQEPAGAGEPPGGGSPEPDPKAPERAQAKPNPAPSKGPPREPVDTEQPSEPEEPSAFEMLSATEAETTIPLARGPKKLLIESKSYAGTDSTTSDSRSLGTGSGAHGGPGGRGRGLGSGNAGGGGSREFAFGGATGAFRAEVCAIPEGTKLVKEIKSCAPAGTFFTNHLNVSPRSFTQGIPGVSDLTEWFAVRYTGKFKVKSGDYYKFRLLSDDGSILYIDGYPVIDNDGHHGPQSKEMTIQLGAGEHDLVVHYYQGPRDLLALQLFVSGSDGRERLFGPEI